ncbi:MAG TPA: methyltransferase domain-containing protein [Tabrizicola sp.]|nr:methyltransferase domain-containing protein [Tabrizicola sp.]
METQDHWGRLAGRIARMGPPQVPGPGIVAQIADLCGGCTGVTVLLGVTPAYAGLGAPLLAFDASAGMIAAVWPGDDARRQARVADWTALPLADGGVRQVIGDGALNAVPDRDVLRAVLREVRRVLLPTGRAALRVFTRPDPPETLDEVLRAATEGRIASLNVLRWRLASALAVGPGHGVRVADIRQAALALGDLAGFARARGLSPDEGAHFDTYAGSAATYVFPDRDSLARDALDAGLTCAWTETAGYPGATDCPIAVLQPI